MSQFDINMNFTNICHNLLLSNFYEPNDIKLYTPNDELYNVLDRFHKIDYIGSYNNKLITFQERCRSNNNQYDDITFRYNDDINKCELTTCLADYMVYAKIDGKPGYIVKGIDEIIVIDLQKLRRMLLLGQINIPSLINNNNGIIHARVIKHKTGSMICINIVDLIRSGCLIEDIKNICRTKSR